MERATSVFRDGKSLAVCGNKAIAICELITGRMIRLLKGQGGGYYHPVFSFDGKMLSSVGGDETLRIWNLETGDEIRRVP